jgi:protein-S-isoprenylcysteine O-methyltransferase Ste14
VRPGVAIIVLWVGFALSWVLAAFWSDETAKQAGIRQEIGYRMVQFPGWILLAVPAHGYFGPLRLWHVTWMEAWVCAGLVALGFAFSWWARIYLGPVWSSNVTRKVNHRVIDSGPYALVRHPIYTGILLAVYATTAAKGTVLGIGAAVLVTIGFWLKARLEERWLCAELGPGEYQAYRRKVPMLLPFGPKA